MQRPLYYDAADAIGFFAHILTFLFSLFILIFDQLCNFFVEPFSLHSFVSLFIFSMDNKTCILRVYGCICVNVHKNKSEPNMYVLRMHFVDVCVSVLYTCIYIS